MEENGPEADRMEETGPEADRMEENGPDRMEENGPDRMEQSGLPCNASSANPELAADKIANCNNDRERRLMFSEVLFKPEACSAPDKISTSTEVPKSKYYQALQTLRPLRPALDKSKFPSSQVGALAYLTLSFLTPLVWRVFRSGKLELEDDLWPCPPEESCQVNTGRVERLWKEEVSLHGREASVTRVFLRFIKTRYCVNFISMAFLCVASFVAPTFLMQGILSYTKDSDTQLWQGLMLVVGLFAVEFIRAVSFTLMWTINSHTGSRARTAMFGLLYKKILKLRSLKSKSVGEFVNICANDTQRMFEAICLTQLLLGGPFLLVAGLVYCILILGPWVLMGLLVFCFYYPFQVVVSRITMKLRRQAIKVTDKRVQMMTEILTCIKLIKLYAWEIPFSKSLADVRESERAILEKAAYLHTMSSAFTPMVPVFAAVATFFCHTMAGNDLNATQAFVVLAVFLMWRNRVIGPVPFAVKSVAETLSGMQRLKDILLMDEREEISKEVKNKDMAVEFTRTVFAWDAVVGTSKENVSADSGKKRKGSSKEKDEGPIYIGSETEKLTTLGKENPYIEVLWDIHMAVPKGELWGICGAVGSGKSSLLQAMLGQLVRLHGTLAVSGSIAYVAQEPWIFNSTLKDNILFGEEYNEERYIRVIEACCLQADLDVLPAADETEIGERGINLSGGQKQRVSLARAVYCDRDIYLLDDPLSALDTHVGQHVFSNILQGLLKDKTVIFVTHQLQYMSSCDRIILMKEGRIHEEGSHDSLLTHQGEYASLINTYYSENGNESNSNQAKDAEKTGLKNLSPEKQSSTDVPVNATSMMSLVSSVCSLEDLTLENENQDEKGDKIGALTEEEIMESGSIKWNTCLVYMQSAGGVVISLLTLVSFAIPVGLSVFTNYWLAFWLQECSKNVTLVDTPKYDTNVSSPSIAPKEQSMNSTTLLFSEGVINQHPRFPLYISIYALTVVIVVISMCIRGFLYMKTTLRASSQLHNQVFSKVLRCPMSFFDTTPTGRVINRFSKDMDEVDTRFPIRAEMFLSNIVLVIFTMLIISAIFPWFLLVIVPLMAASIALHHVYNGVIREMKRADNVTRSPTFGLLTATVQGIHTISAYGKQHQQTLQFYEKVDRNTVPYLVYYLCTRWLSLRLDLGAILIVVSTAFLAVLLKGSIPTAMAGLAMAYAVQMTGLLQFTLRMASEAGASFTSVERIYNYSQNIEMEAPHNIPAKKPAAEWPTEGAIKIEQYSTRYRQGLPLVLKDITCDIQPHEKIGIIGRTGAGKSSLVQALFRLIEPEEGRILIDGIDTSQIGLADLRSSLAVIPQDPTLFVGTIRYNLDPFQEHLDDDLWQALEKCHCKQMVKSSELQLDTLVVEGGCNFSVGERQLLCMARALLRHSKILVLDEATAAIDTQTDAHIQTTLQEVFADCTVLTIAHRLNTVLHCDRIMILSNGQIIEFEKPATLLADPKSSFAAMCSATEMQLNQSTLS